MAMGAAHTCTWLYGPALEKVVILKQPDTDPWANHKKGGQCRTICNVVVEMNFFSGQSS